MQIGIRLHDSFKTGFEERLHIVHEQGFKCIHLAMGKIEGLSWDNIALTPGYASYIKKAFQKEDLDVAVLGCYLNLGNPDVPALNTILAKYYANIRFASMIGAGVLGTETGNTNPEYKYDIYDTFSGRSLKTFTDNLSKVIEAAEKFGVTVAIEPVWKHIVSTPERALKVLNEISSPNLGIILDPVNLIPPDKYNERNELIKNAIQLLGESISMIHIKDCHLVNGSIVSCAAGTGDMDYTDILEFIKKNKPYIHVTLENTLPENAETSRIYLENLYNEI